MEKGDFNLTFDSASEYHCLLDALIRLNPVHVHIHHMIDQPPETERLVHDLELPYDISIHDYYYICPRIHLCNPDGKYCGEPSTAGCNTCIANNGDHAGVRNGTTIEAWRDRHADWLANARRVFVPHSDVGRRLERYFPRLVWFERPHLENLNHARLAAAPLLPDEPLRVALLGAILPHKGQTY